MTGIVPLGVGQHEGVDCLLGHQIGVDAHAGFPGRCASPVATPEGQAALVADVYQRWMPGAGSVAAQNVSVLFQNAGNPGDPQVQAILKGLPDHGG